MTCRSCFRLEWESGVVIYLFFLTTIEFLVGFRTQVRCHLKYKVIFLPYLIALCLVSSSVLGGCFVSCVHTCCPEDELRDRQSKINYFLRNICFFFLCFFVFFRMFFLFKYACSESTADCVRVEKTGRGAREDNRIVTGRRAETCNFVLRDACTHKIIECFAVVVLLPLKEGEEDR